MGGGLMQLVAYGAQDAYLTGKAEITFFKVTYRRHTNFACEPIQQTFNGNAEFGRTVTANINRNGDLITKMYLVAELSGVSRTTWGYVRRVGHAMINYARIEVGGTTIDEQYGDWLNVYHELARNAFLDAAYAEMIGDVEDLTNLNNNGSTDSFTLYVPLQFWFNRHNGLALPLIALQYHDVKVTIQFRAATDLVNYQGTMSSDVTNSLMSDAYLLIDYIYLDNLERKKFAQNQHEYLIEQVQYNDSETLNASSLKYTLNFNHPTKYLAWNVGYDRYVDSNSWLTWAFDGDWDAALDDFAKKLWIATRDDLTDTGNGTYEITVGSNTLNVGTQPTTSCDATSMVALLAKFSAQLLFASDEGKAEASVNNVVIVNNELTLEDINVLVSELDFTVGGAANGNTFYSDYVDSIAVNVRDYFNYSINPNCNGNPVNTGKLVLNGHDRFTVRDGKYFNAVQPWQHFRNSVCHGLNVYSFALEPLEHQPSGSCNFSRIDNTTLSLNVNYNSTADTGVVRIYAVNVNIFRVMSGMGGLAYSN